MGDLSYLSNKALLMVLLLSAVPVIVATVVGLLVGLFQTVTQLQEQTLPYGIKLVSVVMSLVMTMGWMGARLLEFALMSLDRALS